MKDLDIFTAPRRDSRHWKKGQITWDELIEWMKHPKDRKEAGNYLLGQLVETTVKHPDSDDECTNYHRGKASIVGRDSVTLDVDQPDPGFLDTVELTLPYSAIIHTTFNSAPDAPRYRVLVELDRTVTPEEYAAIAEVLMGDLGAHQFDPGSSEAERYMFRPSAQHADWFVYRVVDGDPLIPEKVMARWDSDLSARPTPKPSRNKRNPFELGGVVGAFNRAYTFDEVIEAYDLPYEPAGAERWHLVGALGASGLSVVGDGLVFSHHANDPAGGQTSSAFDLVRLHRFGHLDVDCDEKTPVNRRPSQAAMQELASTDARVTAELVGVDFDAQLDDQAEVDWRLKLRMSPRTGKFLDEIGNWDLVRQHDPVFSGLYFNELTMAVETDVDFPWRPITKGGPVVTTVDRAAFRQYLEREYKIRPAVGFVDDLIDTTAQSRFVHPVRDYLTSLTWDGVSRIETCLPGVRSTIYTRLVARKSIVAAVGRVLDPGVKWDHALVLFGSEGLGKSYWIEKMSRGWTATMGRIGDKDTLLIMHRSWIMVADEGHSLKKADADVQKEFLTRTEDVFRMPYDRETTGHKRAMVIWSTTNDETFLRRQEGNRRYLIVRCEQKVDFEALTDEYIDQVWAEAVHLYQNGERLFLEATESDIAAGEREQFTEEDALGGLISEFLDVPVADDWYEMSPEERQQWQLDRATGMVPVGTLVQNVTCSLQLWVEAMGRRRGDHKRADLLEISAALKRLPGWRQRTGRHRIPGYGPQLVFERIPEEDQ